jgi:hypothetical protein
VALDRWYYETLAVFGLLTPDMSEEQVYEEVGNLLRNRELTKRVMAKAIAEKRTIVPTLLEYMRSLSKPERIALRDIVCGVVEFPRKAETSPAG